MKSALNNAFATTAVPDDRIRLAFQAMWRCRGFSSAPYKNYGAACPDNRMSSFGGTHRANFNTWVNSLQADSNTPSHMMIKNAGEYMKTTGLWNPYAKIPGVQETPLLSCRKSFLIFMTDGEWNSESSYGNDPGTAGNADGTNRTLPDGVLYDVDAANTQTRIYRDAYGVGAVNTVSDFVFDYWATDLQPSIPNEVQATLRQPGTVNFGTSAAPYLLEQYWNPKNDPANWQHLVTYTIGFSGGASLPTSGATSHPWWGGASGTTWSGGDYAKLVQGITFGTPATSGWGNPIPDTATTARRQELWHMAINGRGRFTPATDSAALSSAFSEIINQILLDTSQPLVSIAANSSSLRSGLHAYIAGYDAEKWSGSLVARPIDSTTSAISATETWNAAALLDATGFSVSNRLVLSYGDSGSGNTGLSWTTWSSLPSLQKVPLNTNSSGTVDTQGQNRVNYIRGDRSMEATQTNGVFRDRNSRLGDIVNSNIWYTGKPASAYTVNNYATFRSATATGGKGGRTPMVYLGANDGMLHGFAASNWPNDASPTHVGGKELLAYIPQGIAQGDLRKLTDPSYSHQYFVDGSPFTGDAFIGSTPAWTTVLVGSLGAGGKGYFVLDVTDPAQFTAANAASLVMTDTTATSDADIGNITSPPVVDDVIAGKSRQIVKMNGGRWAVVMGNGYNSTNEAPVLLIQYLDGDKSIKKLSPCSLPTSAACSFKGGNGLSSPQLIDLNSDGMVDVAYAGDLKGNVWKFNLTSATDSNWSVAFSGQPFFVAKPSATVTQPITTAPYWMQHPQGGIMLAVGTGQNLTLADQTTTGTDSMYALYDNSTFSSVAGGPLTLTDSTTINTVSSTSLPSTLVQQTITGTITDAGTTYYTSSSNTVNYGGSTPARGWYLNWSNAGQRVLHNSKAFTGQKILVQSTVPKSGGTTSTAETCTPVGTDERSFLSILNMFTGKPSVLPAFTLTSTTTSNVNITTLESNAGSGSDNWLIRTDDKVKILKVCPAGQSCDPRDLNPDKYIGLRANWREIQ
ncbi:pilus assembly protein [Polaromonas hydrogenivorans]|uniref:PilC/PilY family type IV pilus protein n=1 Tax=Polaromonas hydrogenivorans TaxID=335476 RepID=A0AAU7LWU5_9BURK